MQIERNSLVFGVGVLLLGGVASAKDDQSALTRDQIAANDVCPPSTNHKDYRVVRAEVDGRKDAKAIEEARAKAREKLAEKVCLGMTDERCFAAQRQINDLGTGYYDARKKTACASVDINYKKMESVERDLDALEASLEEIAAAIKAESGSAPLQLAAPTWAASSCAAGELGAHLLTLLKGSLSGVMLLGPEQEAEGMRQLKLELSESSSRVAMTAATRAPSDPGWTSLDVGTRSFPSDLFTIDPGEDGECASTGLLGMDDDLQLGSGGLWARLDMPPPTRGVYCEGEPVSPKMSLNQDAMVRLYTVQQDGTGYLVWSSRGRAEYAARPTDLSPSPWHVAQTHDGSDSQLVLVTVPQSTPFGSGELPREQKICSLRQPLHADQFPPEAALHVVSYRVLGADNKLCSGLANPEKAAQEAAKIDADLADALPCP